MIRIYDIVENFFATTKRACIDNVGASAKAPPRERMLGELLRLVKLKPLQKLLGVGNTKGLVGGADNARNIYRDEIPRYLSRHAVTLGWSTQLFERSGK